MCALGGTVIGEYTVIGRAPRNPAVQLKDEIRDLACFVGIYPHAYAWPKDLPERVKV